MKIFNIFFLSLLLVFSNSTIYADNKNLLLPVLVGQTGASATFGKNELDAYTLAVEEWNSKGGINGKQIKLAVEDTRTDQMQVVTAFQRIATSAPSVILGPTWLDGFQSITPLAKKNDILVVTPSASIESFTQATKEQAISFYHNSTLEAQLLRNELAKLGKKKVTIIHQQEPFAEMFTKLLNPNNELNEIAVQAGDSEFTPVLTRLKANKADALVLLVWDERSLSALFRQIRILMPEMFLVTIHDGESWVTNPIYSSLIYQLYYPRFIVKDKSFIDKFKKRFGYQPILTASNAYDAMNSVLLAMQSGKHSAKVIREFLLSNKLPSATVGTIEFNSNMQFTSELEVVDYRK